MFVTGSYDPARCTRVRGGKAAPPPGENRRERKRAAKQQERRPQAPCRMPASLLAQSLTYMIFIKRICRCLAFSSADYMSVGALLRRPLGAITKARQLPATARSCTCGEAPKV